MSEGHGSDDIHQQLTLESLLAEPLLRSCPVFGADADDLAARVEWCLPLGEAVTEASPRGLEGVVIVARPELLAGTVPADIDAVGRLRRGGAVALLLVGGPDNRAEEIALGAGIPVAVASPGTTFYQVSRIVAEKRLARDAHAMAYGVSVHRELADVLYRGSGLAAMARRISRLSSCPAFLLDTQFEVLAYESLSAAPVPDPDELIRTLRSMVTAGRVLGGEGHGSAECVQVQLEHQSVSVVLQRIVLGGTTYGWVVIVELEDPPHPHDLAQHLVVAEQAVMISGSEMLRLHSVEEAEERARGDFVHALLHGRFASTNELVSRAAHHDFDVDGAYAVVAVRGVLDAATTKGLARQANLVRSVTQLGGDHGSTLATPLGDLLVVVRKVGSGRGRRDLAADQASASAFAQQVLDSVGSSHPGAAVSVGRPGRGMTGIMSSYREARIALEVARRLHHTGVAGYSDLRVFAVLAQVAQEPEGTAFAEEVFAPLHPPGERGDDLEAVLLAYIDNGGNLNAAARALFMHRNTVLYKLDKASRLLGMDIRSSETQFTIWLAHRIRTLAEVEAEVGQEISPVS